MSILLTDKEIEAIPVTNFGGNVDDLNVAKAQLKKVVEWLERGSMDAHTTILQVSTKDWQALLKEIE